MPSLQSLPMELKQKFLLEIPPDEADSLVADNHYFRIRRMFLTLCALDFPIECDAD